MCGFGTTVVESSTLVAACWATLDGREFEFIYTPAVLGTVVSWNPRLVAEAAARENYTTLVHDALPNSEWCGLGSYGDGVGVCCHEADTGCSRRASTRARRRRSSGPSRSTSGIGPMRG